jgi:hypothetical protein
MKMPPLAAVVGCVSLFTMVYGVLRPEIYTYIQYRKRKNYRVPKDFVKADDRTAA